MTDFLTAFTHYFVRSVFLEVLDALPPAYLVLSENSELYTSRDEAVNRLKNYTFSQGFVIVGKKRKFE